MEDNHTGWDNSIIIRPIQDDKTLNIKEDLTRQQGTPIGDTRKRVSRGGPGGKTVEQRYTAEPRNTKKN